MSFVMYLRLSTLCFLFALFSGEAWGLKKDKLDHVLLTDGSLHVGSVLRVEAESVVFKRIFEKRVKRFRILCADIREIRWSSQRTKANSFEALYNGFRKALKPGPSGEKGTPSCGRIVRGTRFHRPYFGFGASLALQGTYYTGQKHWFAPVNLQLAFQFFPTNSQATWTFLVDASLFLGDSSRKIMLSIALGLGVLLFFGKGSVRFFLHPGLMVLGLTTYTLKEHLSGLPLRPFLEAGLDIRLRSNLSLRVALRPQVEFVAPHLSVPLFHGGLSLGLHIYD